MEAEQLTPKKVSRWRRRLADVFGRWENWKNFSWWLLITVGAGLAQVWILLLFILSLLLWPEAERQFGTWDISRILGDSVLLFFATSLLGQTIYTLSDKSNPIAQRGQFLWFFMTWCFIGIFILYFQTMLWGESANKLKYFFDIILATQVLAFSGFVELKRRRGAELAAVQETQSGLTSP